MWLCEDCEKAMGGPGGTGGRLASAISLNHKEALPRRGRVAKRKRKRGNIWHFGSSLHLNPRLSALVRWAARLPALARWVLGSTAQSSAAQLDGPTPHQSRGPNLTHTTSNCGENKEREAWVADTRAHARWPCQPASRASRGGRPKPFCGMLGLHPARATGGIQSTGSELP